MITIKHQDTIITGPEEVVNYYIQLVDNRMVLESNSKFPVGTLVRFRCPKHSIINRLMSAYTPYEATLIAKSLADQVVKVIAVDKLKNLNEVEEICCTIEDEMGMMYIFPEDFFTEAIETNSPSKITMTDCNKCVYCQPHEGVRNIYREPHKCTLLGERVLHNGQHPKLPPLPNCPLNN